MTRVNNPFITSGYISADYFCDREIESKQLIREIVNGNNLAIISTRRMGKTGLIQHCFHSKELSKEYYTFFVDIYATKSLRDFIFSLSKVILESLKPFGKKAVEIFINSVLSLQAGISYDFTGTPSFNIQLGDIQNSMATLEEIFKYLAKADKPCIVAIDEFQQIAEYQEKGVEALLRSYIQFLPNVNIIFAGSKQHLMQEMFTSSKRPFYQSTQLLTIGPVDREAYACFAVGHFAKHGVQLPREVFDTIYDKFDGHTWYIQCILNRLYGYNRDVDTELVVYATEQIVSEQSYSYADLLKAYSAGHVRLLKAIAREGCVKEVLAGDFISRHRLRAASSVSASLKKLLDNEQVYQTPYGYIIYDRFMGEWLRQQQF